MRKHLLPFFKYGLLVLVLFSLFKIFVPRSYPVPTIKKRAGTQYMQLQTGSQIGYTFLTGKAKNKKPYLVIYLHGGPGAKVSDLSIQLLWTLTADGYDVLLYDQVGGGQSGRLKNVKAYTVDRHINDLQEIIKNIGATKVILIGQSWGGILATLFTARHPAEIEKIILTSPGPLYPYRRELETVIPPDSFHLKLPVFTNQQGNDKANNLRTRAMTFLAKHVGIKLASDQEADDFATYLGYEVNKSIVYDTSMIVGMSAGDGFYAGIMTFKSLLEVKDSRPILKGLLIPVLVMKGQYDNQPWGFTNEYLELFKNHQLAIIPNAGHAIQLEQPELYLKYLREFLDR